MNCKPGDLAMIVKARYPQNLGLIVRVIRQKNDIQCAFGLSDWEIEGEYLGKPKNCNGVACDSQLRPIRDTPGDDETLQWAPVPSERVTA